MVDYIFLTSFVWGFKIYDMYGNIHKFNGLHALGLEITNVSGARNIIFSVPDEDDVTKSCHKMLTAFSSLLVHMCPSAFNYVICAAMPSQAMEQGGGGRERRSGHLQL